MTMKITREKNVLTNQRKDIIIKNNTTFWFKSFINHENEHVELHDYDRVFIKERIINIYIEKDDYDKTKL